MSNPVSVIVFGPIKMNTSDIVPGSASGTSLPLTFEILVKIIGAFTLIGGLVICLGLALIYLTSSLLHLGPVGIIVDAMAFGLPTLYCCYRILGIIAATERSPEFNQ